MAPSGVLFDGVWKKFRRGELHNSLRDLIPAVGKRMFGLRQAEARHNPNDFWAVKDASFQVCGGEAFGIIGANGAGKSTTLKLLTRILKPTRGQCAVRGRVGALIEVAAGFHPDLTGRENIYLQGAIMGMKRREIHKKLDAIVGFAGVEEFLDTPIKRYSSGMNARLGFSIAAHMEPDALLIDEALAVGDLAFQERCYTRMQDFKRSGVAIVFVSHNLSAVASLCDRVALFEHGRIAIIGSPAEAFSLYAAKSYDGQTACASGSSIEVLDGRGESLPSGIAAGARLCIKSVLRLPAESGAISFSLRIRRIETGQLVYLTTSTSLGCAPVRAVGQRAEVRWGLRANFARGQYIFEVAAFEVAHRRELLMVASPPLSVQEQESEQGTTYLATSCEVGVDDAANCLR